MSPALPPLDRLILDAWERLKPRILSDSAELARRLARRHGKTFSRPPRAWCLAIRAGDRRIGVLNACIDPDYATDPHDADHPGYVIEHTVTLTATLIRALCCPVRLHPPGEIWDSAAKKLGTSHQGLTTKRINGTLHTHCIPGLQARRGRPVPIVFTPRPLDPGFRRDFDMPHPLWTGNEFVSARVPNNLQQTILRVPVYSPTVRFTDDDAIHPEAVEPPPRRDPPCLAPPDPDYVWYKWTQDGKFLGEDRQHWRKSPSDFGIPPPPGAGAKSKRKRKPRASRGGGSLVFRGWNWRCPKCSRLVRTIYLLLPPPPLLGPAEIRNPKLEIRNKFKCSKSECFKHSGFEFSPEILDLFRISDFGFRVSETGFACYRCHRIRGFSPIAANSWNDLVSYFSGGLLYGHEVPEPPGYRESARRKNRYTPQANRPSPRREKLLELVLSGLTPHQIAARMHLKSGDVFSRITMLLKNQNVPDRPALALKYGGDPTTQPARLPQVRLRRNKVLDLLRQDLPATQIAKQLGVKPKIIWQDTYFLCREHGVKGREELMAKCEVAAVKIGVSVGGITAGRSGHPIGLL